MKFLVFCIVIGFLGCIASVATGKPIAYLSMIGIESVLVIGTLLVNNISAKSNYETAIHIDEQSDCDDSSFFNALH